MLNQHALDPCRPEIPVTHGKISDVQVTAIIGIGVIVLIEIPGLRVTATSQPISANRSRSWRLDGRDFHHKIASAINVEKYLLQLVANRQLQRKVGQRDS